MTPVFPRPNPRHPRRRVAFICCFVLACGLTLNAQNNESEVARARDEFLSKVFTTCGQGTAYLGPHELYKVACTIPNPTNGVATAREVKDCAELIEYKDLKPAPRVTVVERPGAAGVPKALHPEGTLELALLPTDRVAAVDKRILLLISYTSSRSQMKIISAPFNDSAGRTQQFDAWGQPAPNVMPSTVVRLGDNQVAYQLPPGTMAFGLMTRKSGQWIFAPGPDFPAQPSPAQVLKRVGLDGGPVADAVGERMRALGPAVMVTPINELLAGTRVIQKIASEKPASCKALAQEGWGVPREGPLSAPPLVRPGTVLPPAAAAMVNPPKFSGTADQFTPRSPVFSSGRPPRPGWTRRLSRKRASTSSIPSRRARRLRPRWRRTPSEKICRPPASRSTSARWAIDMRSVSRAEARRRTRNFRIPGLPSRCWWARTTG